MATKRIGEVAREVGIGIETIRFYERERLISPSARRPSGYREYEPALVERLRFILEMKELGFTLAEIRELLRLRYDAESRCDHVRALAQKKISEITAKIKRLRSVQRSLEQLVRDCERTNLKAACPLLQRVGTPSARKKKSPTSRRST